MQAIGQCCRNLLPTLRKRVDRPSTSFAPPSLENAMQVHELSPRTVGSSGSQRGPRSVDRMPQVPHGTRFRTASRAETMAQRLGWFSIALGLTELVAPSLIARLCGGHGRHTGLIRMYGLREIASGLLIFRGGRRPATGMWS